MESNQTYLGRTSAETLDKLYDAIFDIRIEDILDDVGPIPASGYSKPGTLCVAAGFEVEVDSEGREKLIWIDNEYSEVFRLLYQRVAGNGRYIDVDTSMYWDETDCMWAACRSENGKENVAKYREFGAALVMFAEYLPIPKRGLSSGPIPIADALWGLYGWEKLYPQSQLAKPVNPKPIAPKPESFGAWS